MGGTYQVLLVAEDNDDIAAIRSCLEELDQEIDLDVISGKEQLVHQLYNPPDLIICDYDLAHWSGLDVLKEVRWRDPQMPFIVISDNTTDKNGVDLILDGASDFVRKDDLERIKLSVTREIALLHKLKAKEQQITRQRKEAYQIAEQKLRDIVEHSTNMFYRHDVNHHITYVSPQAENFLGYSPHEAMQKWTEFVTDHPVNEEGYKTTQRAIETGEAQPPHELELRKKDGEKIWVQVNEAPITEEGRTVSIVGSLTDITTHRQYEEKLEKWKEKLQESVNRYQTVAKATSDTIWDLDLKSDTVRYNKNIHGMFGYGKEAVEEAGGWWRQKIHHEDRSRVVQNIEDALSSNTDRFQMEYRFQCADGSYKYIYDRAFIVADKEGQPVRVIGAMQDVTQQKEEEQWLRLMETAIGTTTESIAIIEAKPTEGPGRKIRYINEAFSQMTGYDKDEAIGKTLHMLNGPKSSKKERAKLQKYMKAGKVCEAEFINYKKNGDPFWMHVSMAPFTNVEGDNEYWICVGRDVTERRERELELKRSLKEKETLLLEIHHRVKNNLAVISGIMQLQAFQEGDEAIQQKLYDSVGRIQTMASIHELLYQSETFSRLNFGENVERLVTNIINTLQVNVELDLQLDLEDVEININQAIPCSLIINEVVTNALKHAFTEAAEGMLSVKLVERGETLTVRITDNGKGLPSGVTSLKNSNTLGLKLIDTLSKQLQADYSYTSNGKGTIFNFTFEMAEVKGSGNAHL